MSYSGGNVQGDISINGQAPGSGGISPQNMAAADALAGRQQPSLRAMADMPMAQAPTVLHSGNDWASRNALRNMEVSTCSITNRPEWQSGRRERYGIRK